MAVDVSGIKKNDLGALVAGALVFILSLMPAWITVDVDGAGSDLISASGIDTGTHAWHEINVLALLLLLLATAAVAVKVFAPHVLPSTLPVGMGVVAAVLAALGTLLLVIKTLAQFESQDEFGVSYSVGPGWSGWMLMIAAVALTAFAALGLKDSGESLPWQSAGSSGSGTGARGSTVPETPPAHPAAGTTGSPTGPPTSPPTSAPPTGQQPPPASGPAGPPTGQQPPPPRSDEGTPPRPPVF